ncbi:MAG: GNAT family N-acetyltransferase [Anaerolineales bacterium]|nr:GNAT family N-acetyltransferase [Anaerolineales bacterium]
MSADKTDVQIAAAQEVDPADLDSFLRRMYPPPKSDFLQKNGGWQHGKNDRWVLLKEKKIIGYCAVIPAKINMRGTITQALWWVDIVIAPQFRGCGYQTLLDQKMQNSAKLKLGFPNELAAKIHAKHRWGVREDFEIRLLPIYPLHIEAVRRAKGFTGTLLRFAAKLISPIYYALLKNALKLSKPKNVFRMETADIQALENIYMKFYKADMTTTARDADYFQRRYLDAPSADELTFYAAGAKDAPTHYLIARHIPATADKRGVTRILDAFGNFEDADKIIALVKFASLDAAQKSSAQVTIMVTLPALRKAILRAGFWAAGKSRFCWTSESKEQMQNLAAQAYWVLGDSDNDTPN